ncbi:hypothetical protein N781_03640 [Pontibacillus halophilus JSM 076056 = DSM 19796]|uniref:Zinc-ribbon domain-containing protein n=1 Tax=Pontibacillus halophilus JSM 076056 = DSM 19796 TaxID=1385510 RepID=A0A0A5I763_9BACI|nr:hypothetical protein [Pontibacillus halophilus]KGX91677.1 hypothetical protein N781_03640 [Pontibacillus halophilus JSM 076056 = DSM 19796]
MAYCPYCGTHISYKNEKYCIACGETLPTDLGQRLHETTKWWKAPLLAFTVAIVAIISTYSYGSYAKSAALQAFQDGESLALEGDYQQAGEKFHNAMSTSTFPAAKLNKQLINAVSQAYLHLNQAEEHTTNGDFQDAFASVDKAEKQVSLFTGKLVDRVVTDIVSTRNQIAIQSIQAKLDKEPSIQELKVLLAQAEQIPGFDSNDVEETIRERIIQFVYTRANDHLIQREYIEAQELVEDALYYTPESSRLKNLQQIVTEEQIAYEIGNNNPKRSSLKEDENSSPIQITKKEATINPDGHVRVTVTFKNEATVPLSRIGIQYVLEGETESTQSVYATPAELQPGETGTFTYIHHDLHHEHSLSLMEVYWHSS